jgi:hypothetical protein
MKSSILEIWLGCTRLRKSTLPVGLRPAPLRLPPLLTTCVFILFAEFQSQHVIGTSFFVSDGIGIAEHSAFSAGAVESGHIFMQPDAAWNIFKTHADALEWHGKGARGGFDSLASLGHPAQPRFIEGGKIKNGKADSINEPAILDGESGDLEARIGITEADAASGPNFAVEGDMRQTACEPFGSGDDIAAARPELASVPEGAASVQFLGGEPTVNILTAIKVNGQSHLGFINHADNLRASGLIVKHNFQPSTFNHTNA